MNAQVLKNHTLAGAPGPRRVLGAYLEETRCEALRLMRNPGLAVPVMILPVALYALFALMLFSDAIAKDPMTGLFFFSAFSIMGISMPALFGLSTSLAMEREMGLMLLKRAQPAPAGSWLVAKIACGVGFGLLAYLPVVMLAVATGKLALDAGAVVRVSLTLIACSVPFCAMGLMMGALIKGTAAAGAANLVYLPGCYLSGLFFPLKPSMYWQAPIWPQFHVNQLAMHAAGVTKVPLEPVSMALAGLVGYTVLFSAIAIWRLARKG
ncbi:MAG TPA: ABC transporter permease [Steroidobacteraceae bacterium]|nr:ABC transporter permease [Steroidobacteraceae bacterium]